MSPLTRHDDFRSRGYAIFRGVFAPARIDELIEEANVIRARGLRRSRTESGEPAKWLVASAEGYEPVIRGVQNVHRISSPFERVRTEPRILDIIGPIIGEDIKSVVTTLFWKPPGEKRTAIAYHQDCAFRRPAESFRNLDASYVELGLALDPHGPANGGLRVVAGSHKRGDLGIKRQGSVMLESPAAFDLAAIGLDRAEEVAIELDPGDVIIWSAYLLHGSMPNTSPVLDRRFFVVAYMRSGDCDVGDPAFRQGRPCAWGEASGTAKPLP